MEQVISYKDRQLGFLQDVESLKQEKAALVAEKARCDPTPSTRTATYNPAPGESDHRDGDVHGEHQPYALAHRAVA